MFKGLRIVDLVMVVLARVVMVVVVVVRGVWLVVIGVMQRRVGHMVEGPWGWVWGGIGSHVLLVGQDVSWIVSWIRDILRLTIHQREPLNSVISGHTRVGWVAGAPTTSHWVLDTRVDVRTISISGYTFPTIARVFPTRVTAVYPRPLASATVSTSATVSVSTPATVVGGSWRIISAPFIVDLALMASLGLGQV